MKVTLTRDSIIGPMKESKLNWAKSGSIVDVEPHVASELIRLESAVAGEVKGAK